MSRCPKKRLPPNRSILDRTRRAADSRHGNARRGYHFGAAVWRTRPRERPQRILLRIRPGRSAGELHRTAQRRKLPRRARHSRHRLLRVRQIGAKAEVSGLQPGATYTIACSPKTKTAEDPAVCPASNASRKRTGRELTTQSTPQASAQTGGPALDGDEHVSAPSTPTACRQATRSNSASTTAPPRNTRSSPQVRPDRAANLCQRNSRSPAYSPARRTHIAPSSPAARSKTPRTASKAASPRSRPKASQRR